LIIDTDHLAASQIVEATGIGFHFGAIFTAMNQHAGVRE
jgi:hypothetical protein